MDIILLGIVRATIAASIERARRKSLQFQPKSTSSSFQTRKVPNGYNCVVSVGSPLSKRVFMLPPDLDEDADMV